jgi:murein L,D-transpeptidase YcbB/YkuD
MNAVELPSRPAKSVNGIALRTKGWTLCIVCLVACISIASAPADENTARRACRDQLASLLSEDTVAPIVIDGQPLLAARLLRTLYRTRDFAPMWRPAAEASLRQAVADSAMDGLRAADFPLPSASKPIPETPDACARRELLLGESLIRLAYSLRFGRSSPRASSRSWNYPRRLDGISPVRWLDAAISHGDIPSSLAPLRPDDVNYRALQRALAARRAQLATPQAPMPTFDLPLRPGIKDARIEILRQILHREGDLAADETPRDLYDEDLALAVKRYQSRHGLAVDGVIGRATLASLAIPPAARIAQLEANLERLRWLGHDLPQQSLDVNIAAFEARLMESGRVRWRAKVVVGKPWRQTPEFRSEIRSLVLNPDWIVPPGILAADILPVARENPSVLEARGLEILDADGLRIPVSAVDWSALGPAIPLHAAPATRRGQCVGSGEVRISQPPCRVPA